MISSIQQFFAQAMKRELAYFAAPPQLGIRVNLGSGHHPLPEVLNLDWPAWNANTMPLPYEDGSVTEIHAYHFLEHLENPIQMLAECQRVLMVGGVLNLCVLYYNSQMQAHDLSHRHVFCEATWANLFRPDYARLDRVEWKFTVGFNLVCGIVERNMCLLTQLIRHA